MPRRLLIANMAVALLLPAQEKAPDVSLTAEATEVVLDLIVRDRKGRPVKDLKAEDVEVTEDGAAVAVKSLRFAVLGDGGRPTGASAQSALDPMREIRLITFLFERMNREPANLARRAAMDVISKASGPNVYFGVLLVRERLRALQTYTTDKAALKRALDAAAGESTSKVDGLADQAESVIQGIVQSGSQQQQVMAGDMSSLEGTAPNASNPDPSQTAGFAEAARARLMLNMLRSSEQMTREWSGRSSLRSLRAAVEQQRTLPGRKTLVYFSEGLQIPTQLEHQFRAVIAAANSANVSIYCVDANGLDITERTRASTELLRAAAAGSMETVAAGADQPVKREQVMALDTAEQSFKANNFTALSELAASTGGFLMSDSNDLSKAAQRLAEGPGVALGA